ncbi:MAG: response regulator transcription factor [Actinomycetota bacterium]
MGGSLGVPSRLRPSVDTRGSGRSISLEEHQDAFVPRGASERLRGVELRKTRVLVAGPHEITRQGVCAVLDANPAVEIVAEVKAVDDISLVASREDAEIVILDVDIPGCDCTRVVGGIKEQTPDVQVLILGEDGDPNAAFQALRSGASGFISKSAGAGEIAAAIDAVSNGGIYLDRRAASAMVSVIERRTQDQGRKFRVKDLTSRETEIARLLVEGLTARRIASLLGISDRTVTSHISNLYRRLGVNNRVDAVKELMRRGLASPPR